MSKLTSNYKLLSNLDLARNDLFNVSKIVGNQYDNLGKDLEITTWDTDSVAGDLVLRAGVNSEDSSKSGRIFLFAGEKNTSADGLFDEDSILDTYSSDKNIYRGIQLNPDSSISAYSLNDIKAIGDESVTLISGDIEVALKAKDESEKTPVPTLKINTSNNKSRGLLDIDTFALKVKSTDVTLEYESLNQTVGPESSPYYSLTVAKSDISDIYSKEVIDSITVNKNLILGPNSTFEFKGGDYTLNSTSILDIDAATSITIDSPSVLIGDGTTSITTSDSSKKTEEINQKLGIYSRANDFILEAGLDSENPGTSTLRVTNANINGALQVYGKITLGKNTSSTENNVDSKISVSKKLILESPEFEIKYKDSSSSILSGTLEDGTTINAATINVTKLVSATELSASGTSTFKGNVTIEDQNNNNNKTSINSSKVEISNDQGELKVSEKTVNLTATELTEVNVAKATYKFNTLFSKVSGNVSLTNESTYSNQAGKGIAGQAGEYAYKVAVTKDSKKDDKDPDSYTAAITTHTLNARTSISTPIVTASDKVEASKLYVGGKYWVYYDADTSSLVFSKVS